MTRSSGSNESLHHTGSFSEDLDVAGKTMQLRRDGICAGCALAIPAGTTAVWFAQERIVRCTTCATSVVAVASSTSLPESPDEQEPVLVASLGSEGESVAGGSAQREYDRRAARELARKQQRVDDDAEWRKTVKEERPIVGRLVTALSPKPQITPESQSTRAWKVGAEGERRVAEVLAGLEGIETLHDRLLVGSNANIDHIAVAPSGVWVIDAKKYAGKVEARNVGGIFRADIRLYVNGRDRTKLVEGVLGQVDVVRETLGSSFPGIEVRGVLCFINSDWSLIMRPQHVKGVTALWPKKLPEVVSIPGPHGELVSDVAAHLRAHLRPGKHS